MTQKPQTRRQYLQRTGGVALTAIGATGLAATHSVSAQSSSQGLIANGLDVEGGHRRSFIGGMLDGFMATFSTTPDAATLADRMRNEFQANREAWVEYGNWVLEEFDAEPAGTVTVQVNVVTSRWLDDDEIVPTTASATYDDEADELTNLEWVDGEADEPDYELPIRNEAAEFAADDLQSFRREFIDTEDGDHSLPDEQYVSSHAGKYVAATRLDDETANALEVLVGDLDGM